MLALQVAIVLALLLVCGFAPGFFFIRRLRWSPLETLCGAIGLSLVLAYLCTWANYCLVPGTERAVPMAWSAVCLALGIAARKDIVALARAMRVRQALGGYAFLFGWTLILLCVIRVYSGAGWAGDWAEHFQRTLFFLHRFPVETPILGGYALPARPPMMNVLAAFFLAQTQDRFEIFQVVFACLNLLMFLPCCLIMPSLGGPKQQSLLPLVALFALSPVVMQATTYTWTRGLTTFFVISSLALYLAGWRKNDRVRMTVAFVAVSAGLLVHYSAGPYAVFLGLHYVTAVFRPRVRGWREPAALAATCVPLLATWFAWSLATYGARVTFASNTTVTSAHAYAGSALGRVAGNVYRSLVPILTRDPSSVHLFDQPSRLGFVRDNAFLFYESNIIFSMGLVGGPLIVVLLVRALRRSSGKLAERVFWFAMLPFCVVLGIAVVGESDMFGVAHVTLLPLEVLGLTLLAGSAPLRRIALALLVIGCAADFSLGVLLHTRVQAMDTTANAISLSAYAWPNWRQKHKYDLDARWHMGILAPSEAGVRAVEDELSWQGWHGRNGGSVTYLGDHVATLSFDGNGILPTLLFGLLGWLSVGLWKQRQHLA